MVRSHTGLAVLAAALLTTLPAGAQPAAPGAAGRPRAGDRVRARAAGPAGWPADTWCEARVAAVLGDTLRLAATAGGCPPGAYAGDVQVALRDAGDRGTHVGIGLLGGLAVGGALGRLIVGNGCLVSPCDGGASVFIYTVLGAGAGALAGAVAGATLPAGTQWAPVGAGRPLRVAGLAVHPGVRVALRPGRR